MSNADDSYLTSPATLRDHYRALWAGRRKSDALEGIQGWGWQITKYPPCSQVAALTILHYLKPIR